jgi:plastocyanin
MSRPRALAPVAAVLAAFGAAIAVAGTTDAKTRTTSVGIGEREYTISVYKRHVRPGSVRFNITNYGEDAHDLRVVGPAGTGKIRGTTPEIKASRTGSLTVKLKRRGVYTLVCTLADHESRGMVARIRVTGG